VPSRVPGIAAIVGGGIWTVWSVVIITDATAPDWPGYLEEMLLSAVLAVGALAVAVTGAWLRVGDDATRVERLAVVLALTGHVAWLILLVGAIAGLVYGAPTAIASTAASIGAALVGLCLVTVDDGRVGALVATAAVGLLIPFVGGWLVFGVCWMAAGLAMLTNPRGAAGSRRSSRG
jgi:hypothetical protein